ncbi:hypothetical protein NEHOM01_0361 [Nematocida homosporus]|uniref:uncharacterized protein n=1 Tax=Nematocida homosporus TaxID=1912981 RepID=UPI0022202AD9|nr:uncharacterized protein NEHOM01_0361 [Nematocida homosporus]KAI5184759.1 hypothetical protein NEHOM01_0361 [Nematocida homosporus]
MGSKIALRVSFYGVLLYVVLLGGLYYVMNRSGVRMIKRGDRVDGESLVVVSSEDVRGGMGECRCLLGCRCMEMYMHSVVSKLAPHHCQVDVLVVRPYEIDMMFKYGVTKSPFLRLRPKEYCWRRVSLGLTGAKVLGFIGTESGRMLYRVLGELSGVVSCFLGGLCLLLAYGPVLYYRHELVMYRWLARMGCKSRQLVIE